MPAELAAIREAAAIEAAKAPPISDEAMQVIRLAFAAAPTRTESTA